MQMTVSRNRAKFFPPEHIARPAYPTILHVSTDLMRTAPRSTRRTTAAAQLSVGGKENLCGPRDNGSISKTTTTITTGNKKSRHRVSTAELARLEDMFRRNTHPSRQQKKDLAVELGMDYKTVTIWFQNKRQTSKRGQPPQGPVSVVERLVKSPPLFGRTTVTSKTTMTAAATVMTAASAAHADAASCLRSVSSPSHNATLASNGQLLVPQTPAPAPAIALALTSAPAPAPTPASVTAPSSGQAEDEGFNVITSRAIVGIRPLLDTLNTMTSRSRERPEMSVEDGEAPKNSGMEDVDPQTASENVTGSIEVNSNKRDRTDGRGRDKDKDNEIKSVRWKRMRTLEWACERQAKRRKLSRERFIRFESDEPSDDSDSSNDGRLDSALSLLSLASTTVQADPLTDVMRGVLLLLSFKHSWHRK